MERPSSSSINEWNALFLHLWTNGTSFFFIYERMERTFSSSLWTNGMHFFLIYEWMEHTSSSMDKWITVIDLYTLNDCLLDGWMDGWMIPLKASPTWTFLSFFAGAIFIHYNQKKSRCKMDDKFDGIVYSLWGKHQFVMVLYCSHKVPKLPMCSPICSQ